VCVSFTKTSRALLLWKTASACSSESFTINYPLLCLIPQMKARPCPGLTEGRLAILLDVQDG
jgi:hypothetical protein